MNERWDGDRTGGGISDGEAFAPPLRTLLDEMARPDWNTEQPEAHLLPHLEGWCAREGSPFLLRSAAVDGTVFVVDLEPADGTTREGAHEQLYALVSAISEPTTVIVESREDGVDILNVTLALTPTQSTFPKGHGHLVRLRVRTA